MFSESPNPQRGRFCPGSGGCGKAFISVVGLQCMRVCTYGGLGGEKDIELQAGWLQCEMRTKWRFWKTGVMCPWELKG